MTHIAWSPTPEFWALCSLIATGVGHWAWQFAKDRNVRLALASEREQKLLEREEDRKDLLAAAEAAAKLNEEQLKPLMDQLAAIDQNGSNRLKVLIGSNVTTRAYAKKAIDVSNGIKTALMESGVKLVNDGSLPAVQEVRVINEDPILVSNQPPP